MKTPLLLLHGALGSAAQFEKLIPLLPAAWEVHALNFPGHGGAAPASAFSIEHFAGAVLEFLDQNKMEQAQIFGYSMGGYTALQLAAGHPDRVAGIITLGTKFHWTPEIATRETALLNPEKIEEKVPVFAQMLAERHGLSRWRDVLNQTAGLLQALGNGAALQQDVFRTIRCPVVIGLGAEDHMVTEEESRQAASLLPHGRFDLLPGVKHPFEQIDPSFLTGWLVSILSD